MINYIVKWWSDRGQCWKISNDVGAYDNSDVNAAYRALEKVSKQRPDLNYTVLEAE